MRKKIVLFVFYIGLKLSVNSQTGYTFNASTGLSITTNSGNLTIGPQGYGWCHMQSDQSMFYFNKPLVSNNGVFGAYYTSNLIFQTNSNPNTASQYNVTRMTILNSNGNVGIGVTNPAAKLEVGATNPGSSPTVAIDVRDITNNMVQFRVKSNGLVYAREIQVRTDVFPDYVFSNNYKRLPLPQLSDFIKVNKHLPGFENSNFYVNNGLNVSEILIKQQEKIEELTLYLIDINTSLEKLIQENELLKQKISLMNSK